VGAADEIRPADVVQRSRTDGAARVEDGRRRTVVEGADGGGRTVVELLLNDAGAGASA
jgi:hypothetical protein